MHKIFHVCMSGRRTLLENGRMLHPRCTDQVSESSGRSPGAREGGSDGART